MPDINFDVHTEFSWFSDDWHNDDPKRVIPFLDLSVSVLYKHLNPKMFPPKNIRVIRNPQPFPQMRPGQTVNTILLRAENELWGNYAIEFGHELCHHVVDIYPAIDPPNPDPCGWIEEFLCEFASLFIMKEMAKEVDKNDTYIEWKNAGVDLSGFADSQYGVPAPLPHPSKLIAENRENLKSRYYYRDVLKRSISNVFSVHLLTKVQDDPQIWQCLQVFKNVTCQANLNDFLAEWKLLLTDELKTKFETIEEAFLGNK